MAHGGIRETKTWPDVHSGGNENTRSFRSCCLPGLFAFAEGRGSGLGQLKVAGGSAEAGNGGIETFRKVYTEEGKIPASFEINGSRSLHDRQARGERTLDPACGDSGNMSTMSEEGGKGHAIPCKGRDACSRPKTSEGSRLII